MAAGSRMTHLTRHHEIFLSELYHSLDARREDTDSCLTMDEINDGEEEILCLIHKS